LAQWIRTVGVIARTSAVKYKNNGKGIDQIGHELGVDYVLEVACARPARVCGLPAQLIRVSDQMHVWSESFDRGFKDVRAPIGCGPGNRTTYRRRAGPAPRSASARHAAQLGGYSAYLKGRHLLLDNKTEATSRWPPDFQRAIDSTRVSR